MLIQEQEKTQLKLFADNLPNKPYCTDEKGWLLIRSKKTAIKKRYIQHNQPCLLHWLVYDCDYAGALEYVGDNLLPPPNIVATNPANGNSHLYYRLADPVCTSELAHRKPLALLAKIDYVLCEKLKADAGYGGFISKNVLHKHWQAQEVHQTPWNLGDFLDWIDIPKRLPKKAKTEGLGRNCTMFEVARFWAYSQVLSYRLAGNFRAFHNAVFNHCETINSSFRSPLNFSEVRSTANSIADWTWRNYVGSGSKSDEEWAKYVADTHTSDIQRERQAMQVESRHRATREAREQAKEMSQGGSTQKAIADALGVSQQTVSRWLKAG